KGDGTQLQSAHERFELYPLGAAADQREGRVGPPVLHETERTNRRANVVELVEVARRQKPRSQRVARSKPEAIEVDDVRDDRGLDAEAAEHVDEKLRRHDVHLAARDASPPP